jgi:hypothetical protein
MARDRRPASASDGGALSAAVDEATVFAAVRLPGSFDSADEHAERDRRNGLFGPPGPVTGKKVRG